RDDSHRALVSFQFERCRHRPNLPHPHRTVDTGGGDPFALRAKNNARQPPRPVSPFEPGRTPPRRPRLHPPPRPARDGFGTIRVPPGLNTAHVTWLVCPFSATSSFLVRASHTIASPASPLPMPTPVRMRVPSGLNAALSTPSPISPKYLF